MASPTNIGLCQKIMQGTNTLTYLKTSYIMDVKSVITLGPGLLSTDVWLAYVLFGPIVIRQLDFGPNVVASSQVRLN